MDQQKYYVTFIFNTHFIKEKANYMNSKNNFMKTTIPSALKIWSKLSLIILNDNLSNIFA
jgi:hypothetical protein